jgi:hypothetical protein
MWRIFGEESDEPCVICDAVPTKIEPTFQYAVCSEHWDIPPVVILSIQ